MTEDSGVPISRSFTQENEPYEAFSLCIPPVTVNPFFLSQSVDFLYNASGPYQDLPFSPTGLIRTHTLGNAGASRCVDIDASPGRSTYPDPEDYSCFPPLALDGIKQESQATSGDTSAEQWHPVSPCPTSSKIMESDGSAAGSKTNVKRPSLLEQSRVTPLQCYLCPKEPIFSDVSHLLTHISSKSHLACRFKLELQKKTDNTAKAKLAAYDDWYQRNRVETLLDNRMAAKKDKTAANKGKVIAIGMKRRRPMTTAHSPANTGSEHDSPHPPHLHHWNTSSGRASLHLHESRNDVKLGFISHTPSEITPGTQLPSPRPAQISRATRSQTKRGSAPKSEQSDCPSTTIPSEPMAVLVDKSEADLAKLKGTVWPGMGIFDAATAEQKRKRNQKKDSSVLRNMITTSESVHRDKFVWDEDFVDIARIRDIYASPSSDGSPEPKTSEAQTAKTKRGRKPTTGDETSTRQTRSAARAATQGRPVTNPSTEEVKLESDSEDEEMIDDTNDDIFQDSVASRSTPRDDNSLSQAEDEDHHFELPRRPALQALSSNGSLGSPTPIFKQRGHSFSGFGTKQHDNVSYHGQPPASSGPFDYQRSFPNPAGLNPLFQPQNGMPMTYGIPSYGQPINPMNSFSASRGLPPIPPSYSILAGWNPPPGGGNIAEFDQ